MSNKICKIKEIRDDKHGSEIVNGLLEKGWTFISACQVGSSEKMDIVYVVGATKEVLDSMDSSTGNLSETIAKIESEL